MFKFVLPLILSFSLFAPFKFIGSLFTAPASVIDVASSSVVRVTGEKDVETWLGNYHAHYSCSGFQIAPRRVMTAAHCIGDKMLADGHTVKILKSDVYYDLALLESSGKAPLQFRDEPVERFEKLTAIGYGFGWTKLTIVAVSVMIQNYAIESDAPVGMIVQGGYIGGMSGGPVIDKDGKVVSIVQRGSEQIGYGVGTLLIRAFLLGEDLYESNPSAIVVVDKAHKGVGDLTPQPFIEIPNPIEFATPKK